MQERLLPKTNSAGNFGFRGARRFPHRCHNGLTHLPGLRSGSRARRNSGITSLILLFLMVSFGVIAQETRVISGTVNDAGGAPIAGASVMIKGSGTGTTTGPTGLFQINSTSALDSVSISAVGYATQARAVGSNTTLTFIMAPAAVSEMDAVTVVGFGRQRRISVVGAQSSINPAELKLPVANMTTLLAGRISGVVGVQRSGEPGRDGADIWIRGISTLGNSAPLVLVDGVARSISNLDPEDIESFTILKDAAGTAVYGARGANGVVLVVTKKGKIGKPQVGIDYNEGVTSFTQRPKVLDGKTYMELANEARIVRGESPIYSQDYINNTINKTDPLLYPNVDWMSEVFNKTARNRRLNLNASGGTENAQYYVSLAYYNETGFLKTDDLEGYNSSLKYTRYNFTSNLNLRITSTTKLDLGLQGYVSNGNYPGESSQTVLNSALDIPPVYFPKIFPDGRIPGISSNGGFRNPYADLTRRGYRTEFKNQLYSNLRLTQDLKMITPGLTITGMFAFDAYNEQNIGRLKREPTYYFRQGADPYLPDGSPNLVQTFDGSGNYLSYERGNGGNRKFYSEASINYSKTIASKHQVGGMVLFYAEDNSDAFAGDFTGSIPQRVLGFAGRGTYSYDDRYFAEINAGYNGSETFSPDNRFGFFPSFGVSWVPSNEKFFEPLKNTISFLKFRYSDGSTGIGTIEGRRFAYLTLVGDRLDDTGYPFGNPPNYQNGINITDYGVDVIWAESRKQDLGIETKLFQDKLSLTFDLFKEDRKGIFLQRQSVPLYLGLTNLPYGNLARVINKGFDANVNFNSNVGKDWTINVLANFTYNNDVLQEDDRPVQPYPWMERTGNNILARFEYVADGLFKDQADIDNSPVWGSRQNLRPGDIKYRDLNGDGLINDFDKAKVSRGDVPSFVYGFGTTIGYKAFNLGLMFQGISNAEIMIGGTGILPFNGGGGLSNAYEFAADRWIEGYKESNDVLFPRLAYGEALNENNNQASSWWVKDVSFMRLKAAELSYALPSSVYKRIGLKNMNVYLIGTNLLTFSKFKLWDPEINSDNGGRHNGARYPNVRVISLGVNARF